jgi:hypothetical protein
MLLSLSKKRSKFSMVRCFSTSSTISINPNEREYFYYVNQEGHVYLSDEKISKKPFGPVFYRDQKFLKQMFSLIKVNNSGKYDTLFPFLWICMKEKNYVACEDTPIVFNSIEVDSNKLFYGPSLFVKFQPDSIFIAENGRFYRKLIKKQTCFCNGTN